MPVLFDFHIADLLTFVFFGQAPIRFGRFVPESSGQVLGQVSTAVPAVLSWKVHTV